MTDIDRRLLRAVPDDVPAELNLTDPEHLETVRSVAEALEEAATDAEEIRAADRRMAATDEVPVLLGVALKLAASRLLLREIGPSTHVSVVFAVYKEHLRILRAREHPAGEDLVREKLRQLRWLFFPTPRHSWDLTVVDDGCPEGSGEEVQAILDEFGDPGEETRVLFLADAIRDALPIVGDLTSTDESRKGGAIRLGLWHAARIPRSSDHHVVLFTDAVLSTHLGQIGLLASPLADSDCLGAVGSRREPSSVVVKRGIRNQRGKLFVYLWKRLVPQLEGIIDTQCGFKAFDARRSVGIFEQMRDSGFSFDVELLLRCQLEQPGSLTKVPVAWIDSEVASTTTDLDPYLPMLRSIAGLYRDTLPYDPDAEPYARLIEGLDRDGFRRLVEALPPELADREPFGFDDYRGVSAHQLADIVGISLDA